MIIQSLFDLSNICLIASITNSTSAAFQKYGDLRNDKLNRGATRQAREYECHPCSLMATVVPQHCLRSAATSAMNLEPLFDLSNRYLIDSIVISYSAYSTIVQSTDRGARGVCGGPGAPARGSTGRSGARAYESPQDQAEPGLVLQLVNATLPRSRFWRTH